MNGKNSQLLGSERSPLWQPSLPELINALQAELAKGEQVYTRAELRRLEDKLAEAEQQLTNLLRP